jgi:hypothetical protein
LHLNTVLAGEKGLIIQGKTGQTANLQEWQNGSGTALSVINSSGNLGIGNTAPLSKLGITGNVSIGATYGEIAAPTSGLIVEGNVGIGTTTPGSKLQVSGNAVIGYSANTAGPANGLAVSGNLGIGTSSPMAILHIQQSTDSADHAVLGNYGILISNQADATGQEVGIGFRISSAMNVTSGPGGAITFERTGGGSVGNLRFKTGDSDSMSYTRMTIKSDGNIGIGYTDPGTAKLAINGNVGIGTSAPSQLLSVAGVGIFGTPNVNEVLLGTNINLTGHEGIGMWHDGTQGYIAVIDSGTTWHDLTLKSDSLYIQHGDNAASLAVSSGGNVGIGTINPGSKLTVAGSPALNDNTFQNLITLKRPSNSGISYSQSVAFGVGRGSVYPSSSLYVNLSSNSNDLLDRTVMTMDGYSGNVGIGTTSPTANLTVSGAGSTPALGTYNAVFAVKNTSTTELQIGGLLGSPYTNWIQAAGSGGPNAYPLSLNPLGGNVGIGTTGPGAKLDISSPNSGDTAFRIGYALDPANYSLRMDTVESGVGIPNWATPIYAFRVNNYNQVGYGAEALSINYNARVGIGYLDAGTAKLAINGNVGIGTTNPTHKIMLSGGAWSDGTVWTDVSDRNLKTNFTTLDPQTILGKIASLSITQWNYKSESTETKHIGAVAQDFYAQFNLGGLSGETSISAMDTGGVALLGIQALNTKTNEFINQSNNQISGLTTNQNKIVNQLTGQLVDQNLTVDNKLQLIGQNLDNIQTQNLVSLQEQIDTQKSDILELQKQIADIQLQNKDFNQFLLAFDVKNIDNFAKLNAPISTFTGQLEAQSLVAGAFSVRVVDRNASTIGDSIICEENKALKDDACVAYDSEDAELLEATGKSVLIKTTAINTDSKVYITPISSTNNQVLYVGEIRMGESFEIKVDNLVEDEIRFNWWIVDEK